MSAIVPAAQSPRRLAGRPAGQREDLVARLRDLAGNYPAGIGILKEFLQNADDAGATWVRFTLDLRHHRAEDIPDERMGALFGPALLVESDQTFTEQDLANIQRIGAAGKIDDAGKTGRFGLGFNTVYSITDYPSFATRDLIMTFDPFFDAVALEREDPGMSWALEALWTGAADWPKAFGLVEGATTLRTTTYRLPLRTSEQTGPTRIGRTAVSPEEVQKILSSLVEWGERLILFLRSVLRVEARVVDEYDERVLASVTTTNVDDVRARRERVLPSPGASTSEILDQIAAGALASEEVYEHGFVVEQAAGARSATWLVAQGMFPGSEGEALTAARAMVRVGEKAIPLGGVAIAVVRDGDRLIPQPTSGTLCCTLPLPQPLGVGLIANARWSLSSSRSHVRFGAEDGMDEAFRVGWNRAVAEHVVPAAYAALFTVLQRSLDPQGVAAVYASWPDVSLLSAPLDRALAEGLFRALAAVPSIRVRSGGEHDWVLPVEATMAPVRWSPPLVEAVVADGLCLAEPAVPEHVAAGLGGENAPAELCPKDGRAWLAEGGAFEGAMATAPRRCLRDAKLVLELLAFCSEGGSAKLDGLPLAFMADDRLGTFGKAVICLGDADARRIFRARPNWFLAEEAARRATVRPDQSEKLFLMSPGMVIANLKTHLLMDEDGTWSPEATSLPNEAWLADLYLWLAKLPDLKIHLTALMRYALVPDSEGNLVRSGSAATPLVSAGSMTRPLERALRAFGVPLVGGSPELVKAISAFSAVASGMVWEVTPATVVNTLARSPLPDVPAHSPHRRELLSWLAESAGLTEEPKTKLQALPLWPTKDGRVVSATAEGAFLPLGFDPPPDFDKVTLLHLGPDERWRPLLQTLGVKPLDLAEWIRSVFVRGYGGLTPEARLRALAWLRDRGVAALTQGTEEQNRKLRDQLRDMPLLEGDDHRLHPPSRLYHPDARDGVSVLGSVARFPDVEGVYRRELDLWAPFFGRLGLHRHPLDADLVARVEQLLHDVTPENSDATEADLLNVYEYLSKRWDKGEHDKSTLAKRLRELAWIPTMQQPAHEDDVAAFRVPPACFMLPANVYPARLMHHAASQVAFMRAKEDTTVRQALGMPSDVKPDVVLAHFRAVRERWATGGTPDTQSGAVGRAASAFYRVVGQLAGSQNQADRALLAKIRAELAGSECIWDQEGHRFWRADHTFARGAEPLAGLRVQISAFAHEGAGLDTLGRRPSPGPADYASVLRELGAHGSTPLVDHALRVARRCWQELREHPELLQPDLPVPTATGALIPASRSLVDDASYWRDRLSDADLPWIDMQVPQGAALRAGAQRVTEVVREERVGWKETPTGAVKAYCANRSSHVASEEFAVGVLRLVAHACPEAALPELDDVRDAVALELVPCGGLSAGLVCPDFGLRDAVGVEPVSCLLDEDGRLPRVWVATEDAESVALELGRALLRRLSEANLVEEVDVLNTAALEAILRCPTDRISHVLDQRKIRSFIDEAADPMDEEVGPAAPEPEDFDGDGREVSTEEARSSPATRTSVGGPTTTEAAAAGGGAFATSRADGDRAGSGPPHRAAADRETPPSGSRTSAVPPIDAPPRLRQLLTERVPQPSTLPADTDGPRPPPTVPHLGQGGQGKQRRGQLLSYLQPAEMKGGGGSSVDHTPGRLATEQAALAFVDEQERGLGRTVTAMDPHNEGYDREIGVPGEAEARIVEVKGLGSAWDARGVRLTPAELRAAHHFGDRYWVYVVEHAKDLARRRLYRIRGPANLVTAYCLDHGWIALDDPEADALTPEPGLTLLDGDTAVGVIESCERRGEAIRLTVKAEDGESQRVNWNPTRHRLQPPRSV